MQIMDVESKFLWIVTICLVEHVIKNDSLHDVSKGTTGTYKKTLEMVLPPSQLAQHPLCFGPCKNTAYE